MRSTTVSLAIGGISLCGLLGGGAHQALVPAPLFDPGVAYEAESLFTGDGVVVEDADASNGACVRPVEGGEFQVAFTIEVSEPGNYGVGIGYRSSGECQVQIATTDHLQTILPPASDSFSELTLTSIPVDGTETFTLTFSGDVDVDYCYTTAGIICVGCQVKMKDTLLPDTSNGGGTEHGGTMGLDQFDNTGEHTFQPNPAGGYDCMGEVDPTTDDTTNGVCAAGSGVATGGAILGAGAVTTSSAPVAVALASNPVGWAIAGTIVVGGTVYVILEWIGESSNGVNFHVASYSLKAKRGVCEGNNCSQAAGCKLILHMLISAPGEGMGGPDSETGILTTTGGAWNGNHDEKSVGSIDPGTTATVTINETAVEDCNDDDGYILLEWDDGTDIVQFDFHCTACERQSQGG